MNIKPSQMLALGAIAVAGLFLYSRRAKAATPEAPKFEPSPESIPAQQEAASMPAPAPADIPAAAPAPAPAPARVSVFLTAVGANKVAVIKAIQGVTGVGLKAAKELVESAPNTIAANMAVEDANKLAAKMAEAGAQVQVV